MRIQLRDRDRRSLLGLGVALALYFTLSQIILPQFDRLIESGEVVAERENQLRRYRRGLVEKESYGEWIAAARQRMGELDQWLIRAESEALASVELQSLIEATSQDAGIVLEQRNIGGTQRLDEYFSETRMTLAFEATPEQFVEFLTDLRSNPKALTVRSVDVRPEALVHEVPSRGELTKTLQVTLTVGALIENAS